MVVYKDENAYGFPRLVNFRSFVLIQRNSCVENRKAIHTLSEVHSVDVVGVGCEERNRERRCSSMISW